MNRYFTYMIGIISFFAAIGSNSTLLAKEHNKSLHLEELMTAQEMRQTGVSQLSEREKLALEEWLEHWSVDILNQKRIPHLDQEGIRNDVSSDPRENTFVIEENIQKGESLRLDDGTVWKIAPKYRKQTRNWTKNQSVVLTRNYKRGYTHQLFNLDFGVAVDVWQVSAKEQSNPSSFPLEKHLRVEEVIRNGERLKLDDGSSWEISPSDRIDAQAWLPEDRIRIERSGDMTYPQKLVNVEHHESIAAKLLSK